MDRILKWIIRNMSKSFLIIIIVFFIPLLVVHILFKLTAVNNFFVAKWTAGELLGYISGFLAFIGTIVLGVLALWQNKQIHNQQIEMLEPNLSMNLVSQKECLYITVENTGQTAAKDIELELIKMEKQWRE